MNKLVIYILGAATGAAVTYVYCKEKYQRENSQDAQEVREYYKNLYSNNEKDNYKDLIEEYEGDKDIVNENVDNEEVKSSASIVFIGEELFGEDDRFIDETIFLYSDGVFTDADRDPISDITKLIGNNVKKILNTDEDSIYIRNYRTNREYEILRLEEEYSEEE